MEYDHGKRVTPNYHELSPLERAIASFETKARDYHQNTAPKPSETPAQRAKREKELKKALRHLEVEKLAALTQVQVQTQLHEYRAELMPTDGGTRRERVALREAMAAEKHHPTKVLARFMRADGRPQPSPRFSAHHIVQGKGRTEQAAFARIQLHFFGIRINDPDNGVWMPRTKADKGHWAMPKAAAHSEVHTFNYETWVSSSIQHVAGTVAFRSKLVVIRNLLRDGLQPDYVTRSSDQ
ncbi:AHH domain-containing protein [Microbulbifer sp. SAOS-129_SWC]|uniref:AHH domain-containing protein n=1 Tax=Microbulbifer sp. SAOS-129_SWC TaxID=3145235 RepID=UPI003216E803